MLSARSDDTFLSLLLNFFFFYHVVLCCSIQDGMYNQRCRQCRPPEEPVPWSRHFWPQVNIFDRRWDFLLSLCDNYVIILFLFLFFFLFKFWTRVVIFGLPCMFNWYWWIIWILYLLEEKKYVPSDFKVCHNLFLMSQA